MERAARIYYSRQEIEIEGLTKRERSLIRDEDVGVCGSYINVLPECHG
ncbi:MAG: hypothetical protein QW504_00155 [Sulfolobales archaeon]